MMDSTPHLFLGIARPVKGNFGFLVGERPIMRSGWDAPEVNHENGTSGKY